jgi:hypothetical protein
MGGGAIGWSSKLQPILMLSSTDPRYRVAVLLRRKSDTFPVFKQFKALAESQLGRKIKVLPSRKPDLSRFRVFGCTAYVFVQQDKRKKLDSHMQKCIFVGYLPDYRTCTFYI